VKQSRADLIDHFTKQPLILNEGTTPVPGASAATEIGPVFGFWAYRCRW
jgi:hypothetical protein